MHGAGIGVRVTWATVVRCTKVLLTRGPFKTGQFKPYWSSWPRGWRLMRGIPACLGVPDWSSKCSQIFECCSLSYMHHEVTVGNLVQIRHLGRE